MIIIWRGIGAMVLIIGILSCLFTNIVTSAVFEEPNYFQAHLWPKVVGLWLTAVCCWFLGKYVNSRPGRTVIDKQTGAEVEEKPYHHLMFIKMEYWGVIFFAFALGLLLVHLARD